jgi:hypothetical protein
MKPTVKKLKTLKGRIVGYDASIGEVTTEGPTPREAAANCERAVLQALARLDRRATIGSWRGHVYVIAPTIDGWSYWLDTFSPGYGVTIGKSDREDAEDGALSHLAQNVWTLDVSDDAAFVVGLPPKAKADITGWIRFQRSYAALKAEGKTDNEAHRLACA